MAKSYREISINVESGTVIRALLLIVATLFALAFLRKIAQPLLIIFVAAFLALALNPTVSWIARRLKKQNRLAATALAYLLFLSFLIAFFALVLPPLVKQTVDFIKDVPQSIENFRQTDSPAKKFIQRHNLDEELNQFSSDFASKFKNVGKPVLSTAGTIGSTVVSLIAALVLTFMMLVEGPSWLKRFWSIQPASKRQRRQEIAERMYKVVTSYVNGQVLIAAIAGIFSVVALFITSSILNVSVNAVALGGIVALFALLPLIGTTLGATIVVLACLLVSLPLAITMAIYFVIYQQIENVTIQPYIQSKSNNLTPLIVFIAAILGVGFGGILGAFVAIPLAGCLRILVEDHYSARLAKAKNL